MYEYFHLKLEPDMRMCCPFERECGFIFSCKPFSFKDGICFLVGADTKEALCRSCASEYKKAGALRSWGTAS